AEKPDYVFVPGDLTKDGAKSSHEGLAAFFKKMEDVGIQVVVIDGNHDINNTHAVKFDGDNSYKVTYVTPGDFKTIYADYGYNQASVKHANSLSYVYPLDNNTVLIAMDVCRYADNVANDKPTTAGGFTPELYDWVMTQIKAAKNENKTVLGMMHHGMLEHYVGQKTIFGEYVIDGYDTVSTALAEAGMNVVFTGHYHAQDVVGKTTTNSFIYDIETGSTVTYPCPYRVIEITADNKMEITGKKIMNIDYDLGGAADFQAYAKDFIESGLATITKAMLTSAPYNLDEATAAMIEPAITETFIAHYEGNEGTPSAATQAALNQLKNYPDATIAMAGAALAGMWNDLEPDDWTYTIDLNVDPNNAATLSEANISVYPNPVAELLFVEGEFEGSNTSMKIYSLDGKVVYAKTLNENKNQ
ncbi:MAG: metallophosphoesterase, partial [Bacteroidales bacterium]|nr:metallophosphoesterase [Bacteroidales bacterium]